MYPIFAREGSVNVSLSNWEWRNEKNTYEGDIGDVFFEGELFPHSLRGSFGLSVKGGVLEISRGLLLLDLKNKNIILRIENIF